MSRHAGLYTWADTVATHLPHLSQPQAFVLALWSFGIALVGSCGTRSVALFLAELLEQKENTLRQRLREWYCEAAAKSGTQRQTLEVAACFADLLGWVLAGWPSTEPRVALALDATTLGQRFTVLALSVLYRGCAIPVAWVVLPATRPGAWKPHWLRLLRRVRGTLPPEWQVIVLADRGLYAPWLYRQIRRLGWHPFLRINAGGQFRESRGHVWRPLARVVGQSGDQWCARVTCFKRRSLACTLAARWEAGYAEPWLLLTDLAPGQVNACWYALRSWIECGFQDTKRGGWQWQATRMTDPPRAARLWLALAVATLWAVSVGGEAEATPTCSGLEPWSPETEERPPEAERDRELSCFRRGRIKLLAQMLRQAFLPSGRFCPEPWPNSLPVKVHREKTYP